TKETGCRTDHARPSPARASVERQMSAAPRNNPRTETERTQEQCRACSPPRSPEIPLHARVLLGLEPFVGALLLQGESPGLGVRLLIAHVEAIAAVRVGVAVDGVPVLRLREDFQRRHRAELLGSLRRVCQLRLEPGGYQQISGGARLVSAGRGAAGHRDGRREDQQYPPFSHLHFRSSWAGRTSLGRQFVAHTSSISWAKRMTFRPLSTSPLQNSPPRFSP